MELTGGCVCGGTRYVLKSGPFDMGDCHCIDCRRSAGAPYVTWGSVPREDVVITKGEPRKITYASRIRSFAACCGTHLFIEDSKDSDTIDVTIASLDDPTSFAPQKAIFLEDKLPWVVIDKSLPSFQKTPNAAQPGRNPDGIRRMRMVFVALIALAVASAQAAELLNSDFESLKSRLVGTFQSF